MTLFMLPRRFELRDARTLEIRTSMSGPFRLTLDGEPLATIERSSLNQWESFRLDDGSSLQVRPFREALTFHFEIVQDQQPVHGSSSELGWRLKVLAALLAFAAVFDVRFVGYVSWLEPLINFGQTGNVDLSTSWPLAKLATTAALLLCAWAITQRSHLAVWAAIIWLAWSVGFYEYQHFSTGELRVEMYLTGTLWLAWKCLDSFDRPSARPAAPAPLSPALVKE